MSQIKSYEDVQIVLDFVIKSSYIFLGLKEFHKLRMFLVNLGKNKEL